jgi:hypothetical protein
MGKEHLSPDAAAFAAALKELYRQYPVIGGDPRNPDPGYSREMMLRTAMAGFPGIAIRYAPSTEIEAEVRAISALIFG